VPLCAQAGIFTNDMRVTDLAWDSIEVGGLNVNDVSSFRIDHMSYGGVKRSGFRPRGRPHAIEENTELKQLTYNPRT
jgi:acyl-CoA reductase-like NAD-dependent aldehyde dehydrogenase